MKRRALIEDTDSLGPAVKLELSRESSTKGRFELSINASVGEEGEINPGEIRNNSEVFTQQFMGHMATQGYRLTSAISDSPTTSLSCLEFDTNGRGDDRMIGDFQDGVARVKRTLAEIRFGQSSDEPKAPVL